MDVSVDKEVGSIEIEPVPEPENRGEIPNQIVAVPENAIVTEEVVAVDADGTPENYHLYLPDDVLVGILEYLKVSDFKTLMPLHSKFYNIITTTRRLQMKIKLVIKKSKLEQVGVVVAAILNSDRRYDHVNICWQSPTNFWPKYEPGLSPSSECLYKILKKMSPHIKSLLVQSDKVTLYFMQRILNVLPDLPSLFLNTVIINLNHYFYPPELNSLRSLNIVSKSIELGDTAELFVTAKNLTTIRTDQSFPRLLDTILSKQSNLQELYMKCHDHQEFFENDWTLYCNFQLRKFTYLARYMQSISMNNLCKFLQTQDCLQDLKLEFESPFWKQALHEIIKMPALEKLCLNLRNSQEANLDLILRENSSVTAMTLTISRLKTMVRFVNAFVALKSLKLCFVEGHDTQINSVVTFDHLIRLKDITILVEEGNLSILGKPIFKMKNLKTLDLHNTNSQNHFDWLTFVGNNPKLTCLKISYGDINDSIIEIIARNLKFLEKIFWRYCLIPLTPSAIDIICEHCEHLKELELHLGGCQEDYYEAFQRNEIILSTIKFKFVYQYPRALIDPNFDRVFE